MNRGQVWWVDGAARSVHGGAVVDLLGTQYDLDPSQGVAGCGDALILDEVLRLEPLERSKLVAQVVGFEQLNHRGGSRTARAQVNRGPHSKGNAEHERGPMPHAESAGNDEGEQQDHRSCEQEPLPHLLSSRGRDLIADEWACRRAQACPRRYGAKKSQPLLVNVGPSFSNACSLSMPGAPP